jgi:predicted polyphosphate/ATP-dependent NAD kinase
MSAGTSGRSDLDRCLGSVTLGRVGVVGIIANPAAGKDIRRLVAHASTFDNLEKVNIVRRVLLGLAATGVEHVLFMPDPFGIVSRALHHLEGAPPTDPLDLDVSGTESDSTCAAAMLRARGVGCIVTLGGDGTNRAVARGCGDVPLVAISTGTNNVFPKLMEGTIAGLAAGVVASGRLAPSERAQPSLCLEIVRDGTPVDLALIDVAVSTDRFVGARAVWDVDTLRTVITTRAACDVIGLSAIGGFVSGMRLDPREGLLLELGAGGQRTLVPVAPGLVAEVGVAAHRRLQIGDAVPILAPGMVALDGERTLALQPGVKVQVVLSEHGPCVVDVRAALRLAVDSGFFAIA